MRRSFLTTNMWDSISFLHFYQTIPSMSRIQHSTPTQKQISYEKNVYECVSGVKLQDRLVFFFTVSTVFSDTETNSQSAFCIPTGFLNEYVRSVVSNESKHDIHSYSTKDKTKPIWILTTCHCHCHHQHHYRYRHCCHRISITYYFIAEGWIAMIWTTAPSNKVFALPFKYTQQQ